MIKNEIVINKCYGGFGLSEGAVELYNKLAIENGEPMYMDAVSLDNFRTNKILIQVVKTLKDKANGKNAKLDVVEFIGCLYRIDEYDGYESLWTPTNIHWNVIQSDECCKKHPEYFL